MIALGGSVAEEMFYGSRSTGSRNDFEQALSLVRTLMDSGLTRLGIIDRQMVTQDELMKENTAILNDLHQRTYGQLEGYRKVFEQALSILVEEETLTGDRFREILLHLSEKHAATLPDHERSNQQATA